MKTGILRKPKELASALLTTLVICSILSMFVMYYLSLIDQQSYLSARSQVWNMAITISEAGIEDGLEELNSNPNYPTISGDGWSYTGSCYCRSNALPDGNSYVVSIFTTNVMNPSVLCRSYVVSIPQYARNFSSSMFAAVGVGNTTASAPVSRAIQVTCSKANLFTSALAVKTSITLNGNGVYTDSFNSQDPTKSTNGKYDSSKYTGDHGDVGTNGGITNGSVSIGNANIYGTVHTGPNCPISMGPNGGIGPHSGQATSTSSAIALGYLKQDANFDFPDTTFPNTGGYFAPSSGTVVVSSNYVTSVTNTAATYPTNSNLGTVTTNYNNTTTGTWPGSSTPGLTTNWTTASTSTLPSPIPDGLTTNTSSVTTKTYPAPGTYVGGISTNVVTTGSPSGRGTWYTFNQITGYSYPTIASYSYPTLANYTYALNTTFTTYQTNTYTYILTSTNHYVLNNSAATFYITSNSSPVLALPNGLTGSEVITWAPGSTLQVYSGGTSVAVSGNNYINPNGAAGSLIVYCAPTVTSFTLNGNGQFTGVLICPNADVAMHGGGNSNEDFCGSLMCNSCSLNGHFSFHWDESLANYAQNGRFLISTWNEVPF